MSLYRTFTVYLILFNFIISTMLVGEAVDDTFALPNEGANAKVHGQNSGKPLIRVLMFGAIPSQGIHYVPEGTDLLFGILYAGGYTETTKLNGIGIRRRGTQELMEVDLEDIIASGDLVPKLRDGDIINVPFNWRKNFQEFQLISGFLFSLSTLILSIVAVTRN